MATLPGRLPLAAHFNYRDSTLHCTSEFVKWNLILAFTRAQREHEMKPALLPRFVGVFAAFHFLLSRKYRPQGLLFEGVY